LILLRFFDFFEQKAAHFREDLRYFCFEQAHFREDLRYFAFWLRGARFFVVGIGKPPWLVVGRSREGNGENDGAR
jgi:hypothetical protein